MDSIFKQQVLPEKTIAALVSRFVVVAVSGSFAAISSFLLALSFPPITRAFLSGRMHPCDPTAKCTHTGFASRSLHLSSDQSKITV